MASLESLFERAFSGPMNALWRNGERQTNAAANDKRAPWWLRGFYRTQNYVARGMQATTFEGLTGILTNAASGKPWDSNLSWSSSNSASTKPTKRSAAHKRRRHKPSNKYSRSGNWGVSQTDYRG